MMSNIENTGNSSPAPGSSPLRIAHLLFVHLATAYVIGIAFALLDIRGNGYLALGFWRSIWQTLFDHTLACGAAGIAAVIGFVLIRSLVLAVWPPSGRFLAVSFLIRGLSENRLTLLLFAMSMPVYIVCRGHSWKMGVACALLWCGMIFVLGIAARLLDAPSKVRTHGPLAALFGAGSLFLLSAGVLDPHALQGFGLNATNVVVALALVSAAFAYFLLLCWYFRVAERTAQRSGTIRPGRAMAAAFVIALLPLVPWVALTLHATPENLAVNNRKNVIVLTIDTLRADRTSILHDEGDSRRDYTPNLRKLAKRGFVFETAISQSPWTMPAFASVLTGKYPHEHGALSLTGYLRSAQLTIAEILREAGYQTSAIVSHTYVDSRHGFDQGCASFDDDNALGHEAVTSKEITDRALRRLEKNKDGKPFFVFLHYFDPHYTYRNHATYNYADEYTGWLSKDPSRVDIDELNFVRHLLDATDLKYLDDLYSEEISHTDAEIGRIIEYLDRENLSDDTAVIVVADHGEQFMEHGWIGHGRALYDELVHVPLICVLPGVQVEPGVVPGVVETRGIFDMILQYLDMPNNDIRGDSRLLNKIQHAGGGGNSNLEPSAAYSTVWLPDAPMGRGQRSCVTSVRTDEWKFIADFTLDRQYLYQLSVDPGESESRISQFPEKAEEMRQSLNVWMETVFGSTEASPQMEMDKDQIESLKALGYL